MTNSDRQILKNLTEEFHKKHTLSETEILQLIDIVEAVSIEADVYKKQLERESAIRRYYENRYDSLKQPTNMEGEV